MLHPPIRPAGLCAAAFALVTLLPAALVAQRGVPAPTNVIVVGSGASATVSWTPVASRGVTYRVLRGLDAAKPGADLGSPTARPSMVDPKVEPGATYFYQVIAVYDNGTTGAAAPVAFTVPAAAIKPAGPAAKSAVAPSAVALPVQLKTMKAELSGQMLPMARASAALANSGILSEFTRKCNPTQSAGGPSPSSFTLQEETPGGPRFYWPAVPGAVAYVVDRAVDGTTSWKLAGTTCGSPNAIRSQTYTNGESRVFFEDISGGVVAGTTYVYRVKAFGAAGEMGWNSTRWTAPHAPPPQWQPTVVTGSTAKLAFVFPGGFGRNSSFLADAWKLTASDGRSWTGRVNYYNNTSPIFVTVLGLPVGTHTFTLTAEWSQAFDPALPRVTATSSAQTTVTIKI